MPAWEGVEDPIARVFALRQRLVDHFERWTDAIEACLEESRALPVEVDARAIARFALTTMEGGVMLARA